MKKIIAMGIAVIVLAVLVPVSTADVKTIHVPDNYATIQAAVDNAADGDTIIVRAGTYKENVVINKSLTIKSESGADNTIVRASNPKEPVFNIAADHITIVGLTIIGSSTNGIYIHSADHCAISNNTISENSHGMRIESSSNNMITGNVLSKNLYGIRFKNSNDAIITNNNLSNNNCGLYIEYSNNNIIANNNLSENSQQGVFLRGSNNNRIYLNNFINNRLNVLGSRSSNIWNSPSKVAYTYKLRVYENYLGNYWSNYKGTDVNKNGIGDQPHDVCPRTSENDEYPLMERFEHYVKP